MSSEAVFAVESYAQLVDEIKPLLPEHWAELAVHKDIPLDPDFGFYERAAATGSLIFMTVREAGALIGYAIWVVKPHPHYRKHIWALNDIVWLHPEHRGMSLGKNLVKFWETELRARNVAVIHVDTKLVAPQLLYLLQNTGYETTGVAVEKRL